MEEPATTAEDCDLPTTLPPCQISQHVQIPTYLQQTYWWAYLHPNAVRLFERQWLVNFILWGNFAKLRDAALDEIGDTIHGQVLQVACVYGDFSQQIAKRLAPDSHLDVVDVAPVQLQNASSKLKDYPNVTLYHQDSTHLSLGDDRYDYTAVFFLLHEQPASARAQTIQEALRVTKPGGKVIFVDYHRPAWNNPFRYAMIPILSTLEPFAMDLWREEIIDWVPEDNQPKKIHKQTFFGELYQKVVMRL